MNKDILVFIKCRALYIEGEETFDHSPKKLSALLRNCGFILSEETKGRISETREKEIYEALEPYLSDLYGLGRGWKTVYSDPTKVTSEMRAKIDQELIYADPKNFEEVRTGGDIVNTFSSREIVGIVGEKETLGAIDGIISSPVPVGENDREILVWALENMNLTLPEKIPCKEILYLIVGHTGKKKKQLSGVNDILKIAKTLGGDSFILSNKQRKRVLEVLRWYIDKGPTKNLLMDAKRFRNKWIFFGKRLRTKDKGIRNFLSDIYQKKYIHETFGARLQKEYDRAGEEGSLSGVLKVLSERPGEFLRRYDSLIRRAWNNGDPGMVAEIQTRVLSIQELRPKIIFELLRYYDLRNFGGLRSYIDKTGTRKTYPGLDPIDEYLIDSTRSILLSKLKEIWGRTKEFSGKKVLLDLSDGIPVNTSERSAVREKINWGSIEIPKKGVLRFFSQWIDPDGTKDLDIHGILMNESGKIRKIDFSHNFSDDHKAIVHSGDVRFVQGDCAEYISVNFDKKIDYRYLLVAVNNFEDEHLSQLENYVGVGIGTYGEVLERYKVTTESKFILAFLVDLREGILKPLLTGESTSFLDTCSSEDILKLAVDDSLDLKKAVTYCIQEKGGILVDDPEEADEILSDSESLNSLILGEG